jgi:TolB-like protein
MDRVFGVAIFLALLFNSCTGTPQQVQPQQVQQQQDDSQSSQSPSPSSKPIENDEKRMSIAILAPKATGLAENQNYLPALVQGEFVSNFSGYSAISVLDRERLDEQYAELLSGYYSDDDEAAFDLGHLRATDYIQTGSITKTATGYALQIQITKTADKMTAASYSGTFTFDELDNLTGIRRASLDLLQKMGVRLTAQAQKELAEAAKENHVIAQTALARGITAQRQGTEVAALSYYFQAASYDPSLMEAASRSSILNANITSGNIGNDVRNDIQWRRDWIARLTETEQFFDSFNRTESMPYTLFYTSDIKQVGEIDYRNETVTLGGIETHLHGSGIWTLSMERALQAVYDGLDATKRKDVWGLSGWPRQGVTNLNYAERSQNFSVVFELLNNQNKVIGRQTLQTGGSWGLNWSERPIVNVNADDRKTVDFHNVSANDISDRMAIRITTVNGRDAETAARNGVLQMRVITKYELDMNDQWRFAKGEIQGGNNVAASLVIPDIIWGDPVISIGSGAFQNSNITSITVGANLIMSSNPFGGGFQNFADGYNQNGRKAGAYNRSRFRFVMGARGIVIQGFADNAARDAELVNIPDPKHPTNPKFSSVELVIPSTIWGVPVVSIGRDAFRIRRSRGTPTSITIPNSVTSIDSGAFLLEDDYLVGFTLSIIIGANVTMDGIPFQTILYTDKGKRYERPGNIFLDSYNRQGRKAGKYTTTGMVWNYSPQ